MTSSEKISIWKFFYLGAKLFLFIYIKIEGMAGYIIYNCFIQKKKIIAAFNAPTSISFFQPTTTTSAHIYPALDSSM